jgi:6-phosphogluconolactonase
MVIVSGGSAVSYAPKFAYVGQDSGSVSGFSIDPSDGTLSSIGGVGGLSDARAIASDLRGKLVFVGTYASPGKLRSYKINNAGGLALVNSATTGNGPFAVAVDPSGRFAYTANKLAGTVSSFTLNPVTGALIRIPGDTAVATGGRDITVDPTGRFVYTAEDSHSKVTAFAIKSDGSLIQKNQMTLGGAFGVKVDPSGRFLYAVGNDSQAAAIYSINSVDGSLSFVGSGPSALGSPHSVEFSPNGKFAFVANTSSDTVTKFTVNLANGALSNAASFGSGNNSFQVRCDPTGQFLYVPNKLSGNVSIFTIDSGTGALTKVNDQAGISGPHQIAITGEIH